MRLFISAKNQRRYRRQISGFSLIELLIVLTIGGILAGVAIVQLSSVKNNQLLDEEARGVTSFLRSAQEKAIGQDNGSRFGVYLQNPPSGRASYTLFQVDETILAQSGYSILPGSAVDQHTMPTKIIFVNPAAGTSTAIIFEKTTGLPEASTTITLSLFNEASTTRTIFVSGNGKINSQ